MDERDLFGPIGEGEWKLYPYAKDLFYHPSGMLSMTLEVYNDEGITRVFSFGFTPNKHLREFLDQIYEVDGTNER
jgi:hypothetical protein